jgi:hypothetical protein
MAKSYFTPKEMHDKFEPLIGDFDGYTQYELADELSEVFWMEFPSAEFFPTTLPGQPDYEEIAGQIKVYRAGRSMTVSEATCIVLDLASQNVIGETDGEDPLEKAKFKQLAALALLESAPCDGTFAGNWTHEILQPLGEQWLALMMEHDGADDSGHANGCDRLLTDIEIKLPTLYLAGLSLGLEWSLKRQLQEAIDNHAPL